MKTLCWIVLSIFALIASVEGTYLVIKNQQLFGSALPQGPALFETSLASPLGKTDTSMTLVSNSIAGGDSLSGYNCFTIDEGRSDNEYVCGSVSGTSVTALERGLSFTNGTSTVTALEYTHRVGADIKITDYPLIQRVRNLVNGTDSFPNTLTYASEPTFTNGTQLIDKTYADNLSFAGVANATEASKGIVELATAQETASSSVTGSSGAGLVLQAKYATSTPGTPGLWSVVSLNDGNLSPLWLDGANENYVFNATSTFNQGFISNASSTFTSTTQYTATSSLLAFISSGLATSTLAGNLTIAKNASTTNLTVSGTCSGCSGATIVSASLGSYDGGSPSSASGSVSCPAGKILSGGGVNGGSANGAFRNTSSYPSSATTWSATISSGNGSTASTGATVYAICINP